MTLTNSVAGGTWSVDISAIQTIGSTTGFVTGIAGGVAVDTYKLAATACYVTYTVTVVSLPTPFGGPNSMCITDPPVTLTTTGGAGTWTSSNTGKATITPVTGDVSAVDTGTTNICYTFTAAPGCQLCETFTVNPVPDTISGPNTVCVGLTITLTNSTGGGTWTNTTGNATVGGTSGIVTGITAGTDVINYTIGTGCRVSKTVTVLPSPAPIGFTTLNVCQGQTLNLTETTVGGTWSTSAGTGSVSLSGTSGSPVTVTGVTNGTATVSYTIGNGCARVVTVTVSTLSTSITGSSNVCTGSTITLTNTAGAGTWTSSAGGVASVTAGPSTTTTVTGVTAGTATITFSYLGCQTTKAITVNQTPAALITPLGGLNLCPGDNVALTATTGAGYTYQWRLGAGIIPGATASSYVASGAGSYTVIIATAFCSATSPAVNITVNPQAVTIAVTGALTTCASTAPTLNATPVPAVGVTYQWLESGVPIAGVVAATFTPTVSGVYRVIATNGFGCSGSSPDTTVNLVASPSGTVTLSGPLTFCAGSSITMTAAAGAGYTYQWRLGGIPIAGATNISYTTSAAGSYSVVVTNSIGCSTTSAVSVVNVSPAPVVDIFAGGDTVFCTGGSVTLGAPGIAGHTFQWFRNGVAITGATSAVYIASATGNYQVRADSTATGCSAMSRVMKVTLVTTPLVQPLSATTFCWGGSVTLTSVVVPGAGTVLYQWYRNGTAIPGGTGASMVATTGGDYSVQITVGIATLCSLTSLPVTVIEVPLPDPHVTFDGTFFHTGTFATYQWYKDNIVIPGATTSMTHTLGAGVYKVVVTDGNGCQSVSANYTIGITTGVTGIINNEVKIYPNPAQAIVHIESQLRLRAVISSMDGRTVVDREDAKDIDISHLADGVYMIKLFDQNGELVKTEKLVKAMN